MAVDSWQLMLGRATPTKDCGRVGNYDMGRHGSSDAGVASGVTRSPNPECLCAATQEEVHHMTNDM